MNPLLESAQQIGEQPDAEQTQHPENRQINAWEHPELVDNGTASYERFMASFGSPARWAGRS